MINANPSEIVSPQRSHICVDKSFAHTHPRRPAQLAQEWRVLVPSAFYYEIFTTKASNRIRELSHFPQFNRVNLSNLLWRESNYGEPTVLEFSNTLSVSPRLLAVDWSLSEDERSILDEYDERTVRPALEFWNSVIAQDEVPGFSQQDISDMRRSEAGFTDVCGRLTDPDFVRKVAGAMNASNSQVMDAKWLSFRRIQTWALNALVLLTRHPPKSPPPNQTNLEHDVQDIEYLMLGLHCGALASCETKPSPLQARMVWRFKLLNTAGVCITE